MKKNRWVDVIKDGGKPTRLVFITESVNSLRDKRGEPIGVDAAKLYIAGYLKDSEKLRVYIGSYGNADGSNTRWTQVTIANCMPKAHLHREQFGKAVFVGPAEEALELFLAHARMME